jgi:hypothetical protein
MESRHIILILKPGKPPNDLTSYQPISFLSILSKVFKKILLKTLLPVVEINRLIINPQFDLRQSHSIIERMHRIVQRINEALENKQYCSAAFSDISQAFDKVWHTGLQYKLRRSLPLNYFLIIKSYLHSRHRLKVSAQNCPQSMQVFSKAVSYGRYYTCYTLQTCQPHQNLPQQTLPTILQ